MTGWLRAGQAAQQLRVSPKTLSQYAKQGKLPYVTTPGGHRRFDPDLIQRLGRSLYQPATTWPPTPSGQQPPQAEQPWTGRPA